MHALVTTCFHCMAELAECIHDVTAHELMHAITAVLQRAIYNPYSVHQLMTTRCAAFTLPAEMTDKHTHDKHQHTHDKHHEKQSYEHTHAAQVDTLIEQKQQDMYTIQLLNTKVEKWRTQYQVRMCAMCDAICRVVMTCDIAWHVVLSRHIMSRRVHAI